MTKVNNEEEFARAVNEERDEIEIEFYFLREILLKIKAKGKVVWLLAIACVAIMCGIVYKIADKYVQSEMVKSVFKLPEAQRAIRLLGADVCMSAFKIAIAGGGIHVLNTFRNDYYVSYRGKDKVIFKRKK